MSDQVTYKGTLTPVDMGGLSLDEKIQEILGTDTLPEYSLTWGEYLADMRHREYYIGQDGTLYKMEAEKLDSEDYVILTPHDDGSYAFTTSFYNGGTYLDEMLHDGFVAMP